MWRPDGCIRCCGEPRGICSVNCPSRGFPRFEGRSVALGATHPAQSTIPTRLNRQPPRAAIVVNRRGERSAVDASGDGHPGGPEPRPRPVVLGAVLHLRRERAVGGDLHRDRHGPRRVHRERIVEPAAADSQPLGVARRPAHIAPTPDQGVLAGIAAIELCAGWRPRGRRAAAKHTADHDGHITVHVAEMAPAAVSSSVSGLLWRGALPTSTIRPNSTPGG